MWFRNELSSLAKVSLYIIPYLQYHFFHEAHFADTFCLYECICHSDCETAYSPRQITGWIINCHHCHESDHFTDEILCEHNSVWIKDLCVTQNCIFTELNRQQVKGHLPVFPQTYQSIVPWICPHCFAKITAALLIKRVITVTFCLGLWPSLWSNGILTLWWHSFPTRRSSDLDRKSVV